MINIAGIREVFSESAANFVLENEGLLNFNPYIESLPLFLTVCVTYSRTGGDGVSN